MSGDKTKDEQFAEIQQALARADARLIAAAPALYGLVGTIRDSARDALADGVTEAWAAETIQRCNAALALARGESND